MGFDEAFGRLVRLTGYGLGVYAVVTHYLEGAEVVTLVLGYVGFEFVTNYRQRKLPDLERRRRNGKT